jgi:hypothetical protein
MNEMIELRVVLLLFPLVLTDGELRSLAELRE